MAYPKRREIEIPLLIELKKLGGEAKPKDLYERVAKHFPELTREDLERKLDSSPSIYKWRNMVQWVRQTLVSSGDIDGSVHGVWKITEQGLKKLEEELGNDGVTNINTNKNVDRSNDISLEDLLNTQESRVSARLLEILKELSPTAFEKFAKQFLEAFGFSDVVVTKRSKDGGIDGYGKLRQGIVKINAAFQCKRWQDTSVPRTEIDKFRGAISGEFDQGIFLTTSTFTNEASKASIKPGAVPIILIDGEKMVELMKQQGIGVSKKPLYYIDIDEHFFDFDDE